MLAHVTANTTTTTTHMETFYGYVKNRLDALLLIEACIAGSLFPLNVIPVDLSQVNIRSGTVLVFAENTHHSMMVRWRGSDSKRYRVISYFYPSDVAHLYGDPPEASIVLRHASDPKVVPPNVSLCTPAQIPSIRRFIACYLGGVARVED
ncbi:hypothetical protein HDU77_004693 [Chytriomyces hyalinus]|nr:hypothetical protein HDU77_004693 [Chytriomyces hyalinus]